MINETKKYLNCLIEIDNFTKGNFIESLYVDIFEKGYTILSNIMLNDLLITDWKEDWGEEYTEILNYLEKTINSLNFKKIETEFCENKDFIKNYLLEILKQ